MAFQEKSIPDPLWLIATGVVTGIIGWIAPQPGQQRVTIDQPASDPIRNESARRREGCGCFAPEQVQTLLRSE